MVSVTTTGFGSAAIDNLSRVLDQRRPDRLSPALVVCSGSLVAVAVRRALGRRPGGVAGITVCTLDRLAEDLASNRLAGLGQHPARAVEIQAAIRAELGEQPGLFGRVSNHRTTEERLVSLHRQLDGLDDEVLLRLQLSGSGLACDAIRVIRGANRRTSSALVRTGVLDIALDELHHLEPGALGPIVLYLPEPTRPFEGRLVAALARRSDCAVLVGLTGDAPIDRRHLDRLAAWSIQIDGAPVATLNQAAVLEVADPDDEVRAAIRDVAAHAALGVPLANMAVLYSAADPYASLLREHLDGAGLPWCGPGYRPLAASLAGRFLLRLLDLAINGLERPAVVTMMASAPVLDQEGRAIPANAWDRLSRRAGIVERSQWMPRLAELAEHVEEGDRALVHGLSSFIEELSAQLWPHPEPTSWAEWTAWAQGLLARYLDASAPGDAGPNPGWPNGGWPDDERAARASVQRVLAQLAVLDNYEPRPDLVGFESIVSAELSRLQVPGRPLGTGLLVAPIGAVTGISFERVVVVGMAEGIFPRTLREDSLLPDRLRAESRGLLAPTETITDLDVRAL